MNDILPHFDPDNQHLYLEGHKTSLKVVSYMDKHKYRSIGWVAYFAEIEPVTLAINSIVTRRVLDILLKLLATQPSSRNSSTVYVEQKHIAAQLGIVEPSVTKAIADLKRRGLIITLPEKKRKQVTINPLYAWNGNLRLWQETVEDYLAKGVITLPYNQLIGDNND